MTSRHVNGFVLLDRSYAGRIRWHRDDARLPQLAEQPQR
jgi:hypothetical protein